MHAWAKEGKVICLFQAASKFKNPYSTIGFDKNPALDEGNFWPTAYAISQLNPEVEEKIVEMLKRASA